MGIPPSPVDELLTLLHDAQDRVEGVVLELTTLSTGCSIVGHNHLASRLSELQRQLAMTASELDNAANTYVRRRYQETQQASANLLNGMLTVATKHGGK